MGDCVMEEKRFSQEGGEPGSTRPTLAPSPGTDTHPPHPQGGPAPVLRLQIQSSDCCLSAAKVGGSSGHAGAVCAASAAPLSGGQLGGEGGGRVRRPVPGQRSLPGRTGSAATRPGRVWWLAH